eukprot:2036508-Prymnesium_polylepis.1
MEYAEVHKLLAKPERPHRPFRSFSCRRASGRSHHSTLAASAVACTVEPSPLPDLSVGGTDGKDGGGGETRLPVGASWRLYMLVMLIGAGHGRSEPSRSGLNTICVRPDAHHRRASGGLSRRQSVMCTPRRFVALTHNQRRKAVLRGSATQREARAMSWRMGGGAIGVVHPKSIAICGKVPNSTSHISITIGAQVYTSKTHRISGWGAARSSNPMSFR